jgi:uncharacterized secreted protein with C-terminal beta-propeller domain
MKNLINRALVAKKKLFIILAAVCMAVGLFTSCENEEPQVYDTFLLPHVFQLHKHNASKVDGIELGHGYVSFLCASATALEGVSEMQFVSVGKVKGLYKITSVPSEGWQENNMETTEGYGYLVRYHKRGTDGWLYRRLYIKEYILLGGADWYCKMQIDSKDWNPFGK